MLNIIDRYIGRQVLQSVSFTLLILIALRTLFTLLDEATKIGEGTYQFTQAAYFSILMIPTRLYEFFPMAMLVGGLTALGTLASQNELTVMRAAGIRTSRIIGSAVKASLLLMLVVFFAGEWLAPNTALKANQLRAESLSGESLQTSSAGTWARSDNEFVYIEQIFSENTLNKVTLFRFENSGQLASITRAERAEFINDRWVLFNGEVRTIESQNVGVQPFYEMDWSGNIAPRHIAVLQIEPDMLTIKGLVEYQDYLVENALDSSQYQLAFWRKITQPLSLIVMIVLASSFVFGPMRSVTMGARLLTGIIVGFGFHIANNFLGPLSLVYQLPAIVGAFIPIILFAGLAIFLLRRAS